MAGNKTVWLVGMMGAGKSTVGASLAERLGLPFIDLDAEIEVAAGRSIPEIFAGEGESSFRRQERAAIEKWAGQEAVVALGGGAPAQPGAALLLAGSGTLVYLRAQPDTLLERLGDCSDRPLLGGVVAEARPARMRALLLEREASYAAAAIVVDTDRRSLEEVVAVVAGRLGPMTP